MSTPTDLYCTRRDVTRRIPLGSIVSQAGIVAASVASTNAITFDGHGLEDGDEVTVRATEGGTLSAPLVAGTTYYAHRLTNASFELCVTPGGLPIDLTTDGVSMVITKEPSYEEHIEFYSRWVDAFLPSHIVPLTRDNQPVHPVIKGIVAELTAKKLLNIGGQDSEILNTAELANKAMMERYAHGIPLRGAAATGAANLAITQTAARAPDARGWGSATLP